MKALVFERSVPRFAAARVASSFAPGGGARVGPLRLTEVDPPELPGPGWPAISSPSLRSLQLKIALTIGQRSIGRCVP